MHSPPPQLIYLASCCSSTACMLLGASKGAQELLNMPAAQACTPTGSMPPQGKLALTRHACRNYPLHTVLCNRDTVMCCQCLRLPRSYTARNAMQSKGPPATGIKQQHSIQFWGTWRLLHSSSPHCHSHNLTQHLAARHSKQQCRTGETKPDDDTAPAK